MTNNPNAKKPRLPIKAVIENDDYIAKALKNIIDHRWLRTALMGVIALGGSVGGAIYGTREGLKDVKARQDILELQHNSDIKLLSSQINTIQNEIRPANP